MAKKTKTVPAGTNPYDAFISTNFRETITPGEFTVKDQEDLRKFDNIIKQWNSCLDIDQSLIYLHSDIEYGSLFDLMNSTNMILKCRPLEKANEPINISLNSFGGSVYEMLGIIDYIRSLPVKVNVIVRGTAMSAAAMIMACTTGTRYASKHAQIMFHELSSESSGKMSDIKSNTAHLENIELLGTSLLTAASKKDFEFWDIHLKRDFYITPAQALEYGVIDYIIN